MTRGKRIDYVILLAILFLVVFGIVMLASASSDLGKEVFDDPYFHLKHQITYGIAVGAVFFLMGLLVPYKWYRRLALILLIISMGLALLVFVPSLGIASGVAQRWLTLGPITFQPSEILKVGFIMYLAAWLSNSKAIRQNSFSEGFLPFLAISGLAAVILLMQNSTSAMVMLMAIGLAMYFASGAKWRFISSAIAIGVVSVALLIVVSGGYRKDRILTFLNPEADVAGDGYQINQALTTIGAGGIKGVGYGESRAKHYLPERIGDSIFAIIAEEWGFIGSTALVSLFLLLVMRGFIVAGRVRDKFGKLLMVGFASLIGVQSFVHIASISGLIPLTGVPLPFISYGGTALAIFMGIGGIMVNISKHATRTR